MTSAFRLASLNFNKRHKLKTMNFSKSLLLLFCLLGCNRGKENMIVGQWRSTSTLIYDLSDGPLTVRDTFDIEFTNDSTYSVVYKKQKDKTPFIGKYKLLGDSIFFDTSAVGGWKIDFLSKRKMKFSQDILFNTSRHLYTTESIKM